MDFNTLQFPDLILHGSKKPMSQANFIWGDLMTLNVAVFTMSPSLPYKGVHKASYEVWMMNGQPITQHSLNTGVFEDTAPAWGPLPLIFGLDWGLNPWP